MKMQKSTSLIIPKTPFTRLCKEVLQQFNTEYRIQATAVAAIQEASEQFLTGMYEDCRLLAIHGKRVTIMPKDMRLVERLRRT
jgi:histone H3